MVTALTEELPVIWLRVKTVLGFHFGVGEFTTHVRLNFIGDWDVHWGYDLNFDPWPYDPGGLVIRHTVRTGKGTLCRFFTSNVPCPSLELCEAHALLLCQLLDPLAGTTHLLPRC